MVTSRGQRRHCTTRAIASLLGALVLGGLAQLVTGPLTASAAETMAGYEVGVPAAPGFNALHAASGFQASQAAGSLQTVPMPPWWNGMCDSGYYAGFQAIAAWNGLVACGFGPSGSGGVFRLENQPGSPLPWNWEWQCVELSQRWLYQEFGLPSQSGNGYQVVDSYWAYIQANPSANYPLQHVTPATALSGSLGAGDVLSFASVNGGPGHTAVVTSTSPSPFNGTGTITTLNQNQAGFISIQANNWSFGLHDFNGNVMPATGWLHYTQTAAAAAVVPAQFVPTNPQRILDTRIGVGSPRTPLRGGESRAVQVAGQGGIPITGATAAVLNVTVTNPSASSYLTVFPSGGVTRPLASNLNFAAGEVRPNLVSVALGLDGRVLMYNNSGTTDVVFDVAGYYTAPLSGNGGLFRPLVPARVLDTRNGVGGRTAPLGAGETFTLHVAGAGGVPATGTAAVVLNITAISPSGSGYLTAFPDDVSRPGASNVNFAPGAVVPNRAIVKVGADGGVSLYNFTGATDVAVDVGGYFTDSSATTTTGSFQALVPFRVLDTRDGTGGFSAPVGPDTAIVVTIAGRGQVPAMTASPPPTAVVLNLTAVQPTVSGFVTAYPSDAARPTASDLNFVSADIVPNLVVVRLGADGSVDLYNPAGRVDLVADVVGYYT